jgi:periplasmic divalent cation tolerance protein
MQSILLVMTNLPDAATARLLARTLVEARLAACVNIIPGVESVYRWQNQIEESTEVTLMIKTTSQAYRQLETALRSAHPYDLPEIIALPLAEGYSPYLHWVAAETNFQDHA